MHPLHSPTGKIISASGDDASTFLQGILTQDVETLNVGEGAFSALLTPQGKILFDFFLIRTEDAFLFDTPASVASALLKRLKMYKLRAKVDLEFRDELSVLVSSTEIKAPDAALSLS